MPPFRLAPALNERMDPTQVRGFGMLAAVALLKPGVSLPQAASEMETDYCSFAAAVSRYEQPAIQSRRVVATASGGRDRIDVVASVRRRGFRAADCLRERGQSAAWRAPRRVRKRWRFGLRWARRDGG